MGVLQDRVVVITGSTRGFGLAVAHACGREGARVVISSRTQEAVDAALRELRGKGITAEGIACDVSQLEPVEALGDFATRQYGRFDVWVNNAGWAAPYGPAMHISPAMFLRTVNTNIAGTYYGSLVAMREFLPRATGKLINVLGRGSDGRTSKNQTAYASSKAWVRAFTQSLAADYEDTGVGIYGINPGMMTTDFLTDLQVVSGYEKRLKVMPTIMRMWAKPPEAPAEKVVWLASAATDGKTSLFVSEMGMATMAGGAVREGVRRLLRRPAPETPMSVQAVPATLPLPNRRGPGIGPNAPGEKR
ncbi:MAG: SDR family NAD(P)-dependent oxidoreductase [Nitrososphaerales archaeon]